MKLSGREPWGIEQVSNATNVPRRTLHELHSRGWAVANGATPERGCLRYARRDVERICRLGVLRQVMRSDRAVLLCKAMDAAILEAMEVDL